MSDGSPLIKATRLHSSQLQSNHKGRRNHMILRSITATIRIAIVYLGMTYHIIAIGTGYLYHIHIGVRVLACARCLGLYKEDSLLDFPTNNHLNTHLHLSDKIFPLSRHTISAHISWPCKNHYNPNMSSSYHALSCPSDRFRSRRSWSEAASPVCRDATPYHQPRRRNSYRPQIDSNRVHPLH